MSSRSLNKATLIGNLTRDPELRYTPQGTAVCTIGLATNRSWTIDSGERREETEFHRLVAWNKLAELCAQLLAKGRKIYVEGRLQTRSWTAQDGTQRTTTEIVIDDMIILDSRRPLVTGQPAVVGAPVSSAVATPVSTPMVVKTPAETTVVEPKSQTTTTPVDDTKKKRKKGIAENTEPKGVAEKEKKVVEESVEQPKEDINADDIPF